MAGPWSAGAALPGGDIAAADFDAFATGLCHEYPEQPRKVLGHYARLYGTRVHHLLEGVRAPADLGRHFGGLFYQREAEFLQSEEWASTPEDVLERRTKHWLHLTAGQQHAFSDWLFTMAKSA